MWSAVLVLLLSYDVARSTATAGWAPGIDVITIIAISGALLMAVLAVTPLASWAGLGIGLVAGPCVALVGSWPVIHARYPLEALDYHLVGIWATRIASGQAIFDPAFSLFLICWLMWVTGAWLSWCVLRWRKPMLGLIPGAAAFSTNVINVPTDQNGYTLTILFLTLALLLWTNYHGLILNATRAHVKLTGDAKWDFWEAGVLVMAAVIVLPIILPVMSTVDRTTAVQTGIFSSWAEFQQRLSHPGVFNSGLGGTGVTGFSADVKLNGPLQRTRDTVFTYTKVGDYVGSPYFRGLDVTLAQGSEWRYASSGGIRQTVAKGATPPYAEDYQKLAVAGFDVKMDRAPSGFSDILFFPSQLYRVDRLSLATEVPLPVTEPVGQLTTLDRLSSLQPSSSAGRYNVTVEYSTATVQDLQAAGTNYPDWVAPYSSLTTAYVPEAVLQRIKTLAQDVVAAAHATTPYDEAAAIESYLRGPDFTYTLQPPSTPAGTDPIDFFLFTSRKGYCEYFATAMGDMLRLLGIPTRLVNGFGPGTFDATINSYVVRGEDAHTWVESYFPGFGWIGFEPTKDNVYDPIPRGSVGNPCLRDNGCDLSGTGGVGGVGGSTPSAGGRGNLGDPAGQAPTGGIQVRHLDPAVVSRIAAAAAALFLLALGLGLRYLRPRTVTGVWKRMLNLSRLAGAERRPGETPLELGRRLQRIFPEAAEPVGALTRGFVVAAYAPPDQASDSRVSVMEAWTSLRPHLLRRVLGRLRPGRA
ncbi:MAG TPA: transglutaminase domain-containing protein [Candidatus Dormibacteraeota bacterium]